MSILKIRSGSSEEAREFEGEMSFSIEKVEDNNIVLTGTMLIKDYLEQIHSIESSRYLVQDIEILREDFGTNDSNILYTFSALD